MAVQPSTSSQSADPVVGAARRRILEDDAPGSSSQSAVPNGSPVDVGEEIEVKPGPSGLSSSTQLPATNGVGTRGKKRRIVSEDEDDDDDDEEEEVEGEDDFQDETKHDLGDEESNGTADGTKSQDDQTKGKALKRRDVAVSTKSDPIPEESSSEDEKPIR